MIGAKIEHFIVFEECFNDRWCIYFRIELCGNRGLGILEAFFIWKDITYYVEPDYMSGLFPQLRMIDLSENETKCNVSMGPYHQQTFGSNADFPFFGDESFLVLACSSSFQAWSFDKATHLTHEMDGYARHRWIRIHKCLER